MEPLGPAHLGGMLKKHPLKYPASAFTAGSYRA